MVRERRRWSATVRLELRLRVVLCLSFLRRSILRRGSYPPATAGTMLISSPDLVEVSSPSRKRTSSPLT